MQEEKREPKNVPRVASKGPRVTVENVERVCKKLLLALEATSSILALVVAGKKELKPIHALVSGATEYLKKYFEDHDNKDPDHLNRVLSLLESFSPSMSSDEAKELLQKLKNETEQKDEEA